MQNRSRLRLSELTFDLQNKCLWGRIHTIPGDAHVVTHIIRAYTHNRQGVVFSYMIFGAIRDNLRLEYPHYFWLWTADNTAG